MTAFLQTSDGDLALVNGRLALVSGTAEKEQKIKDRLGLALGEWFIDTRIGAPWFVFVLGHVPDLEVVRRFVRSIITSVPGVVDVPELVVEHDGATRETSVTWRAIDDEGQTISGGDTPFIFG